MPLEYSDELLDSIVHRAAKVLFQDHRIQAIGIRPYRDGFALRAIINKRKPIPLSLQIPLPTIFSEENLAIFYVETANEARPLLILQSSPIGGSGLPIVPEQQKHQTVTCGLQIQNLDSDDRVGLVNRGRCNVGTLGCLAKLHSAATGLLSCNHVIGGNTGDRIVQPSSNGITTTNQIATLFECCPPLGSAISATEDTAIYNQVDAAFAILNDGISFDPGFLPSRGLTAPVGKGRVDVGDRVFKVGRTTGYTEGEVTSRSAQVARVPYPQGPCWFNRSIEIEGRNGSLFAGEGDSGAVVVKETGEIVGIVYAGNGSQTWACPIDIVLHKLKCSLL